MSFNRTQIKIIEYMSYLIILIHRYPSAKYCPFTINNNLRSAKCPMQPARPANKALLSSSIDNFGNAYASQMQSYEFQQSVPPNRFLVLSHMKKQLTCVLAVVGLLLVVMMIGISRIAPEVAHILNKKHERNVTAVFTSFAETDLLEQSINSFMKMNTYVHLNFVVVLDAAEASIDAEEFIRKYSKLENMKIIVVPNRLGELAALDLAYANISTLYYFSAPARWRYTKSGFIQKAIEILDSNVSISQVNLAQFKGVDKTVITQQDSLYAGFSLLPSLHRTSYYKLIEGGYTNLTLNVSYGKLAGSTQIFLSHLYSEMGVHSVALEEPHVEPIFEFSNPKYLAYQYDMYAVAAAYTPGVSYRKLQCIFGKKFQRYEKRLQDRKSALKQNYIDQVNGGQTDQSLTHHEEVLRQSLNYEHYFNTRPEEKQLAIEGLVYLPLKVDPDQISQQIAQNQTLFQRSLAEGLAADPEDERSLQAEYIYMSAKYKIDKITEQQSICVFVESHSFEQELNFTRMLQSIERQNYTSYKAVFIDDFSNEVFSSHLQKKVANLTRLSRRIVHNIRNMNRIGTVGNLYLQIPRFCSPRDIVVVMKPTDILLGNQVFKVINSVYQRNNIWMGLLRPLSTQVSSAALLQGSKEKLIENNVDTNSYIITFLYETVKLLPFEELVQLRQDKSSFSLMFSTTQFNYLYVYKLIEICGKKFQIIQPYFVLNGKQEEPCYQEKSRQEMTSLKLKGSYNSVSTLNEKPVKKQQKLVNNINFVNLKLQIKKTKICLLQQEKKAIIEKIKFNRSLQASLSRHKMPEYYAINEYIQNVPELPFCILVSQQHPSHSQRTTDFVDSVIAQKYSNWRLLVLRPHNVGLPDQLNAYVQKQHGRIRTLVTSRHSYLSYRELFELNCQSNSLVMLLTSRLRPDALPLLNTIHQRQSAWMTYSETDRYVQINTFYLRLYDLLNLNDFDKTNRQYLDAGDQQIQALGMLELTPNNSLRVAEQQLYFSQPNKIEELEILYLRALKTNDKQYNRTQYSYLLKFCQQYPLESSKLEAYLREMHDVQLRNYKFTRTLNRNISKFDQFNAYHLEQIPYLPSNHLLNLVEYAALDRRYEISKFTSGEYANKSHRFCLAAFGRNNTDYNRVRANVLSILQQNYTNFHIVYIDDASDDGTLEEAKFHFNKAGFPPERIRFVRNLKRKFATYNMINAAFNFCHPGQIVIRMDSDDNLLGRQVLNVFNAVYHKDPNLWLAYSTFKTSYYSLGTGFEVANYLKIRSCQGTRRRIHYISPVTTWRVELGRAIPLSRHLMEDGNWLDTLSDDAIQYVFEELASIRRIRYLSVVNYNYNVDYGYNDNSDADKVNHRFAVSSYVEEKPNLAPLKSLQNTTNKEVQEIMSRDFGVEFQVVLLKDLPI